MPAPGASGTAAPDIESTEMNKNLRRLPLAVAISLALPALASAQDAMLGSVVVTAPQMAQPLTVEVDPKAPQQPLPASDGASLLKNIPGFSIIRKGGTDGDPVLRGLAGSRLPILLDGMDFHGGCNHRMDPPTAYVFPESYSNVRVIKGPQTVLYGNGNAAGVVLFENERVPISPGVRGEGSLLVGSWSRRDVFASGEVAGEQAALKATITHAESGNYEDGDGTEIHSRFKRQSATLVGSYELDRDTRIDLDGIVSRGKAAYADRAMDGSKFDRESYGMTFRKQDLSPVVKAVNLRLYHSYIDHVMDNYSMRDTASCVGGAATGCAAMNPDRETDGARVSVDLALGARNQLTLGADWRRDEHTTRHQRGASAAAADTYKTRDRLTDYKSRFTGVFGELTHELSDNQRLIGGLRLDDWKADRTFIGMGAVASAPGTAQGRASETLRSGFLRYEQDLSSPATVYVGYGMNQRPMDYWEANLYEGIQANTSGLRPETTHQLDAGLMWKSERLQGSLSAFYAKVDDYILLYSGPGVGTAGGPMGAGTMPGGAGCLAASGLSNSRNHQLNSCLASGNVDATRYGAEADIAYRMTDALTLRGSLAYVRATNDTINVPLAQTPPLEAKIGADYTLGAWGVGGVIRAVARQDRIHARYGNIAGVDRGTTTPGFATLSLNGSYALNKQAKISFGVDNLFDRTYAEHLSKGDATILGYTNAVGDRVNEPGRTFWLKAQVALD
ncbi:TonB-dependent receptor domain-containing protein [Thauera mechernichensis]|uniref:TonB-dependent receptor domain-containing protein n=2 Tax=Thauera TaxID=33057 RepID=A0ABW3W926_9RHOO|nr:TonB-dependent receptor [Thauera mechernichensis]MDG3066607.1 TonB-dependent receptor [Thauera mechernichensis]